MLERRLFEFRHCLPDDPKGKLDIPRQAGYWLRDERGRLLRTLRHICWDGCMFPNALLLRPETWNAVLATMLAVRDVHGCASDRQGLGSTRSALRNFRLWSVFHVRRNFMFSLPSSPKL